MQPPGPDNLFVNYLSRIHREEVKFYFPFGFFFSECAFVCRLCFLLTHSMLQDFQFILKGMARLLSNPLLQTYLPNSTKKIQFHQELLVLFWKLCDFNKVQTSLVVLSSRMVQRSELMERGQREPLWCSSWSIGLGSVKGSDPRRGVTSEELLQLDGESMGSFSHGNRLSD